MKRRLVRFDWAMKRLLRSKANFGILEGFLGILLEREVSVLEILESESNKTRADGKFNRVDLKVRIGADEIVLIELQASRELDYLQRVLFGAAKALTEHIAEGETYERIVRVISVSLLYCPLGCGTDFVYRGVTSFRGLRDGSELLLDEGQKKAAGRERMEKIFPEFYLIRVDEFDQVARDPLEQWLHFLKRGEIPDDFDAPGLERARMALNVLALKDADRWDYEHFIKAERIRKAEKRAIEIDREIAREKGLEEGREEGREEARRDVARRMLASHDDSTISEITGLSPDELVALRRETGGEG